MINQLSYNSLAVPANGTASIRGTRVGGFLCMTGGTITITRNDGSLLVNAFPVTAGQWLAMPFYLGDYGGSITAAGGASGTLAVA